MRRGCDGTVGGLEDYLSLDVVGDVTHQTLVVGGEDEDVALLGVNAVVRVRFGHVVVYDRSVFQSVLVQFLNMGQLHIIKSMGQKHI